MDIEAEVRCKYKNDSTSGAIASSLEPDNLDSPKNVDIKTERYGRKVQTNMRIEGDIETLIATLDDLLSCTSTAEKMI
ncbi:MAG: KEOPS complex subunit Pcc1 [Candidatus Hadarchaeia archaeon]